MPFRLKYFILVFLTLYSLVAQSKVLSVGINPQFGLSYYSGNKLQGIEVDLVRKIFDQLGQPYQLIPCNVERAQKMLRSGELDALSMSLPLASRQAYSYFLQSKERVKVFYQFIGLKGDRLIESSRELKDKRIATLAGNITGTFLDQDRSIKVEPIYYLDYDIEKILKSKRADLFLAINIVAKEMIKDREHLMIHPYRIPMETPFFLALSKKSPLMGMESQLTSVINRVFDEALLKEINSY